MSNGSTDTTVTEAGSGLHRSLVTADSTRAVLTGGGIILLLLFWVFWDFFQRQILFAYRAQADWGHTLVIPFIAGYLVYLDRERLLARPFRTTWIGFLPIIVGILWYIACNVGIPTLRNHNLMGLGVGMTVFGIVLLFFGVRATLLLLFPMLYLFIFGQTISQRVMNMVTYPLQDITSLGSYLLMDIALDIDRRGNTLFIFHKGTTIPLNIAEACSGMRMLMAFLAIGVFMARTGLPRWWQRVLLVLCAVPTAIIVNILRVITLSLLSILDVGFAAGDFHSFIGLVWLVPAYFLYLGLRRVIQMLVLEVETSVGYESKDADLEDA